MKFNNLTYRFSLFILAITVLYTFIYSGLTGLLLCSAVALITGAFIDQFELVVAIAVIFSLFYIYYLKALLRKLEPFENLDNPETILKRLSKMKGDYNQIPQSLKDPKLEPAGVYDPAVEGFEDIQPKVPKDGESQQSSSAPAKRANEVDSQQVQEVTSAVHDIKKKTDKDRTDK